MHYQRLHICKNRMCAHSPLLSNTKTALPIIDLQSVSSLRENLQVQTF
jgi:hypothetical protein